MRADLSHSGFAVCVNGESRRVGVEATLLDLLRALGLAERRVAVALNRDVIPRSELGKRRLAAGDRVEVLEAVGGG